MRRSIDTTLQYLIIGFEKRETLCPGPGHVPWGIHGKRDAPREPMIMPPPFIPLRPEEVSPNSEPPSESRWRKVVEEDPILINGVEKNLLLLD
jgi:hypothetical protein